MAIRQQLPPDGARQLVIRTNPGPGELRFVGMVIYRPVLDLLSEQLKLTDDQKGKADAILKERREALLKFVDENPPPTLTMAAGPRPPRMLFKHAGPHGPPPAAP